VGDTEADVTGAHRAGIRVVGFGPDPALAAADAVVHSMTDLPRALAALEDTAAAS
jgi:phosphoglycolate phosphatase-like HAD superfamily hydrolase